MNAGKQTARLGRPIILPYLEMKALSGSMTVKNISLALSSGLKTLLVPKL
jgi:hypothetical protein